MRKIRILVIPPDRFGVGYYRCLRPHTKLYELFGDEFDVTIQYDVDWRKTEFFLGYDIIQTNRGLNSNREAFLNTIKQCKEHGTKFILDLDDYWNLEPSHPLYQSQKAFGLTEKIIENIKLADYVTTTTDIFAKEIRKYTPNVVVFPNAIDPTEEQFIPKKIKSDRIRFGFVMGSSHIPDMQLLRGMVNKLSKETLEKIQIVLCGFDLRGNYQTIMPDGSVQSRRIRPEENVWGEFERIATDNYSIISPEYKEWLMHYIHNGVYPNEANEPYARRWTKDVMNYCSLYNNLDVLLVPLLDTRFNSFKSELKFIEAGFLGKAIVASNTGPYTICSENYFERGGTINHNGNCILIDQNKGHKDWPKTIEKLAQHPEYIKEMSKNLQKTVMKRYDLAKVSTDRANWYKEIVGELK